MIRFLRVLAVSSLAFASFAAMPSAAIAEENIIETSDRSTPSYYNEGVSWEVIVEQWEGAEQKASQQLRLQTKGDNTLAEFMAPAKVSGRKLLMRDRSMWFFKPGLLKPVPISPRQRLLGAASFGDLVSVNYAHDYTVTKTAEADVEGEACFVFDLAAKSKDEVYPKLKTWISKSRKVGIRTEYFTDSGSLLKWATFDFKNTLQAGGQTRAFISRMVIHDPNAKDSVAVLRFGRIQLTALSDATFDLNLLGQ